MCPIELFCQPKPKDYVLPTFSLDMEANTTALDDEENSLEEQQKRSMIEVSSQDADYDRSSTFSVGSMVRLEDCSNNFSLINFNNDEDRAGLKLPTSNRSLNQNHSLGELSLTWFDGGGLTSDDGRVFQSVEGQLDNLAVPRTHKDANNNVPTGQCGEDFNSDSAAGARKIDWFKMYHEATSGSCAMFGGLPKLQDSSTSVGGATSSCFQPVHHLALSSVQTTSKSLKIGSTSAQFPDFWRSNVNRITDSRLAGTSQSPLYPQPIETGSIIELNCIETKKFHHFSQRDCPLEEDTFSSSTLRYHSVLSDALPAATLQSQDIVVEFFERERLDGGHKTKDGFPDVQSGSEITFDPVVNSHSGTKIGEPCYEAANDSTDVLKSSLPHAAAASREVLSFEDKVYVDAITDNDVLCGRGGKSNHHPGNRVFLAKVTDTKPLYKASTKKSVKTKIAQTVVDYINKECHGRFLCLEEDEDKGTKRWFVAKNLIARTKAGQALRDDNTPEARAAKRRKYSK